MKKANYIIHELLLFVGFIILISIMVGQYDRINKLETQSDYLHNYVTNYVYPVARHNGIKTSAMYQYLLAQDKEKLIALTLHMAKNADTADRILAKMNHPTNDDMLAVLAALDQEGNRK